MPGCGLHHKVVACDILAELPRPSAIARRLRLRQRCFAGAPLPLHLRDWIWRIRTTLLVHALIGGTTSRRSSWQSHHGVVAEISACRVFKPKTLSWLVSALYQRSCDTVLHWLSRQCSLSRPAYNHDDPVTRSLQVTKRGLHETTMFLVHVQVL